MFKVVCIERKGFIEKKDSETMRIRKTQDQKISKTQEPVEMGLRMFHRDFDGI